MNTSEFNTLFEQTVEMCRETLCHKADEYAEDDDRLHNFNIASILQGNTPIESLGGMMVKHTVQVKVLKYPTRCGTKRLKTVLII